MMWLLLGGAFVATGWFVAIACTDPEAERQIRRVNEEPGDPWLPRLPDSGSGR